MRETDIRPQDLLAEYLRLNDEDGRRLLDGGAALEKRACPGCGDLGARPAFEKNGFSLVRCGACDSLYADPAPTDEAMEDFYRSSPSADYWANVFFPAVAEARRGTIYRPRAERVAGLAADHGLDLGTVLDVGAGAGLFLQELHALLPDAGLGAVEPNPAHAAALGDRGFGVFEGYANAAAADPAWAGKADLVTCFEVLEHVSDAAGLLESLSALVRPGGMIVLSGLNGSGFDIRTLGERSKPVSPPHHLTFLSPMGAARLLERAGLENLGITTPGELDVDIVRNAVLEDPDCVDDPAIRRLVLQASDEERQTFQESLKQSRQSSHMWITARRPGQKGEGEKA